LQNRLTYFPSVVDFNEADRKISLSMKALETEAPAEEAAEE